MATVNPHIFREYDIRGLVEKDLTPEAVALVARGFARMLRDRGGRRLVLGRDCRSSSTAFARIIAENLNACGVDVVDIGVVPTPLTYFAANTFEGLDGLWMITGSHNPPEYNGFKIGVGKTTLHGPEIQELRRIVEKGDFPVGSGTTVTRDAIGPYLDTVRKGLRIGPRKLRILIDAGNGVGGLVAKPLYESLGFQVDGMYLEPDGTFPNHHPDPTVEKNVEELRRKVVEGKYDCGLAFDGDADRLGVVDDRGQILWGDQIMILLSRAVLKEEPGAAIVGEVKCSQTMYDDIARHGGKPVMWKAGHSLIKAKMKETNAALAGEMSGHLFFRNRWFGFDDGVYSGARFLELLSHEERPLSRLLDDVPKMYASPEIRYEVESEEKKFALVKAAVAHFKAGGNQVIDIDGARVVFSDGWGLVRASNTQPILVLRFEAKTQERLDEIRSLIEGTLKELEKGIG
jgi:phosphomannomutase/phosphoglucomutase